MRVLQSFTIYLLILASVLSTLTTSFAEGNDIDRLIQQGLLDKPDAYTYNHVGRSDPF